MLHNLDRLEWHPNWYKRVKVKTEEWDEIEVYHMPLDKNGGIESEQYLNSFKEWEDENFIYYNWKR